MARGGCACVLHTAHCSTQLWNGSPCPLQVWVKILEVRQEGRDAKVGASMRAVSQEDGADLDPNNALAGARPGPRPARRHGLFRRGRGPAGWAALAWAPAARGRVGKDAVE